jgi:carbon monoxide dehydrogenase subunit G
MASIRREVHIDARPETAWDALRDVGALHHRLVPGFVTNTVLEEGARVVTFGNGMVVKELLVDVDDATRRVAWAAVGTPMLAHHNASAQVFPDGAGCRFVWIADLLPHSAAPAITAMIEQGLGVIRQTLERAERERAA